MRERALVLISEGHSKTDVAGLVGVHRQTVQNWARHATQGKRRAGKPGPRGGRKVEEAALRQAIAARPDARLKELGQDFGVHPSTISYAGR